MTKKKITVVSIDENNDNNGDIVVNNEVASPEPQGHAITTLESIVEEPIIEERVIETKTEVKQQASGQTPTVEDKIVRTNELITCPKCDKLVTEKTLKYSHNKTCSGVEDKTTPTKPKQIPDIDENISIKAVPPNSAEQ